MDSLRLKELLPAGSDYLELKVQQNRSRQLGFLNGTLNFNSKSASSGIMARSFQNGVWGLTSSPDISDDSMRRTIKRAIANAQTLHQRARKAEVMLPSNSASGEYLFFTKKNAASTQERIEYLREIDNYIKDKYPDLSTRIVNSSVLEMEKHIVTSDGAEIRSMTPRTIMYVMMVCLHEGTPLQHYDVFGGFGQWEDNFADPSDLYEKIDLVYQQLMDKKEAVFAHAGTFDCVLDSRLAGILSHEAIGHTTEADFVINGSIAGEYLGQEVASPLVTLIDVAHTWDDQLCPVPVFIDDEGVLAEDCVVIEDGILRRYMHNKESAQLMGHALTGNARAYTYTDEPLIRMRNTMIVPGKSKLDEMIASIEDGYYLIEPSNGQADSTSEFMFGVTLGYEIKNGKLGKAIKETTISGVAFDLLKTITMISDDIYWSCAGMCGKKQMIPVGMGGPAIKCRVNIGGK